MWSNLWVANMPMMKLVRPCLALHEMHLRKYTYCTAISYKLMSNWEQNDSKLKFVQTQKFNIDPWSLCIWWACIEFMGLCWIFTFGQISILNRSVLNCSSACSLWQYSTYIYVNALHGERDKDERVSSLACSPLINLITLSRTLFYIVVMCVFRSSCYGTDVYDSSMNALNGINVVSVSVWFLMSFFKQSLDLGRVLQIISSIFKNSRPRSGVVRRICFVAHKLCFCAPLQCVSFELVR